MKSKRLDAGTFHRLRADLLEAALDESEARRLLERATIRRQWALERAGLDPTGDYALDPRTRTITVQPSEASHGRAAVSSSSSTPTSPNE